MNDFELLKDLSNAFGPSGFEDDVVKVVKNDCKQLEVRNDAMNNVYLKYGTCDKQITIMLDAHSDELGFMIQAIHDNGLLSIVPLGGWHLTNLQAHAVWIKNQDGDLIKGIIAAKPVHFMTDNERNNNHLDIEKIMIDVGASNKDEIIEKFKISIGDAVAPAVEFEYNEKTDVFLGKAFDNRVGCFCVIEVLKRLAKENKLEVNVVGALAAQEEVGTRGAQVTANQVKPDLAIIFEGSPADDSYFPKDIAQGALKNGVQIRNMDRGYIANVPFMRYACDLAQKNNIKYQMAVRRGGSTNAAKISLSDKAVPCLVLGIPTRYVHSHYGYCAKSDIISAIELAVEVCKNFDSDNINKILKQI